MRRREGSGIGISHHRPSSNISSLLRLLPANLAKLLVIMLCLAMFIGLYEAGIVSWFSHGWEKKLRYGTLDAYAYTAEIDLKLARKALSQGRIADGESRVAKAQDKLYAPQLGGQAPASAAAKMKELEDRYGKEFKAIRLGRAFSRLDHKGAEIPDKAGPAKP